MPGAVLLCGVALRDNCATRANTSDLIRSVGQTGMIVTLHCRINAYEWPSFMLFN